jgi:predicted RNase H-like nuclease (RuvC/YqgF family)
LGKITPSFRELYEDVVRKLESGRGYANTLLDLGRKEAFSSLLEEAWGPEHAAMANANLATPIDSLNLTANVQNRKLIKLLEDRLNDYRRRLEDDRKKISELEGKLERLESLLLQAQGIHVTIKSPEVNT